MNQTPSASPPRLTRSQCQAPRAAKLIRRLLAEIVAECQGDEATLWTISPDGLQMDGAVNFGDAGGVLETASVPVTDSVVGLVASMGRAVSIGPEDFHNASIDRKTGKPTLAMLAVPVLLHSELAGVLSVVRLARRELFGPAQHETVEWKAYLLSLILAEVVDD